MILFVTCNDDTFSNPTICGVFQVLKEHNIKVKLIVRCQKIFPHTYNNVDVYYLEKKTFPQIRKNIFKYIYGVFAYLFDKILLNILVLLINPSIIVGIDTHGIIQANSFRKTIYTLYRKSPRVDYLSFEIFFTDEGAGQIKKEEIESTNYINNLIIQDKLREGLLRHENKISAKVKTFYIPVSPYIVDENIKNKDNMTIDFRKKHNIDQSKKMIIFFGTFSTWSGGEIIIETLKIGLPDNYIFVIHTRNKLNPKDILHYDLIQLSESKNTQVIISDEFINTFQESITFLQQFDMGIALYVKVDGIYTGKNIYNIGLSSGKFSMYIKAGLPVITNDLPTFIELNNKYNYGFIIKNSSELIKLLNTDIDYTPYSNNLKKLYNDLLLPDIYLNKYVKSLMQ